VIATVAETFHVLPSVAARDLDEDPERLSLLCLPLLRYAEAKQAEENSKSEEELKAWKGSKIMEAVLENKFSLHKERIAKRQRGDA
jgi:hypothetical protein